MGTKRSKERKAAPASPVVNDFVELADLVAAGKAQAELQRLSEYRALMLLNLAHDLRTPLTAILGFTEILIEFEKLTASQQEICERIHNSGRELQSTINLVSDLARLDLDAEHVVRHEFSLAQTLAGLCEALSRKAKQKQIALDCRVQSKCGTVVSDESKLRQILYNVLAWSIVRSPERSRVTVAAAGNEGTGLQLTIRDEGKSIDVSRGFASEATGIDKSSPLVTGLKVSQQLAEMLGATFTFASRKPRGLAIVLQLPKGTLGGSQRTLL